MAKSKVTDKFQVTIPREVRDKAGLRAGELVEVVAADTGVILVKRFGRTRSPLSKLIGRKPSSRHIPIEEVEEAAESA